MGYRTLRECVDDLKRHGQLVVVDREVDPYLEAGAIQRRVYAAGGPALYFPHVKGTEFPLVANLFGTLERTRFLFRDTLDGVRRLVELKVSPAEFFRHPLRFGGVPATAWHLRPRRVKSGPILAHTTAIDRLPHVHSWPLDGGAFVTLPLVYTEDPDRPGLARSNLGMYRVQLSGNQYEPNREVGLHYQIHRGIGVHHAAAIRRGKALRVSVSVGGPPALTVAAVMPLPEGLPELAFAGALGGRRVPMVVPPEGGLPVPAEADFVITGTVDPHARKPEGPFGDHLGYYSLAHDFPVLRVERVYHRPGAIWPFTTVGRPPQEDTSFGALIHELTGPLVPSVIPGVHAVHAVDAAGVHPLLLAIASERYVPYAEVRRPQEILTSANAILGQGQMSLAKYLLIVAREDDPELDIHDVPAFFRHLLERVDWTTDLHFQTRTTIDTLDYSGHGLNQGSKVVIAAAGPRRRTLPAELPPGLRLPDGFVEPRVALPGVLVIRGPSYSAESSAPARFCRSFAPDDAVHAFALVVVADDSEFTAHSERNFLWVTFTRSNPAADVDGLGAFVEQKHWGCTGPLVIDARIKPHHAPPLVDDPEVEKRVDALGAPGGPLHGII
jgi:4-hydroxy-3-polyprenylbenzoate decarboxylase